MCKGKLRRLTAALLVAVCVLCALPVDALAAQTKVQVTAESANLYEKPSTSSKLLRKPPKGSIMNYGSSKDGWAYVQYDGVKGYVQTSKLTKNVKATPAPTPKPAATPAPKPAADATPEPEQKSKTMYMAEMDYLYASASKSSTKQCEVSRGTTVVCLKTSGDWARVQVNGKTGYMLKKSLSSTKPAATPTPAAAFTPIICYLKSDTPIYSSNSTSASVRLQGRKGNKVRVTATKEGWGKLTTTSNVCGFVQTDLLSKTKVAADPKPAPAATFTPIICYLKSDTPIYSSNSASASAKAQGLKGDKVRVTATKEGWGKLTTTNNVNGFVPTDLLSKTKVSADKAVVLEDWFSGNIQKIFSVGTYATVIDVDTGISFQVRRKGGYNHADTETVSAADTKSMLKAYGGKWSWDRHAIWVVIDGVYYAASMNGMGHGEETKLSNDMEGHFCIHFLNSRTHGTDQVCPKHKAAIKKAYTTKP